MKQLLQHYKEVREKANPDNWDNEPDIVYSKCGFYVWIDSGKTQAELDVPGRRGHLSERLAKEIYPEHFNAEDVVQKVVSEYQKEQLELESLLYGYWEREFYREESYKITGSSAYVACEMIKIESKTRSAILFNEWLEEELDKLED